MSAQSSTMLAIFADMEMGFGSVSSHIEGMSGGGFVEHLGSRIEWVYRFLQNSKNIFFDLVICIDFLRLEDQYSITLLGVKFERIAVLGVVLLSIWVGELITKR